MQIKPIMVICTTHTVIAIDNKRTIRRQVLIGLDDHTNLCAPFSEVDKMYINIKKRRCWIDNPDDACQSRHYLLF
jgi:hypothetical protein